MDGTLLDHFSYSFDAAKPCISALQSLNIPIIPNTSKTSSEVKQLMTEIGLKGPLIVENGAAVLMPIDFLPKKPKGAVWEGGHWVKSFANKRQHFKAMIDKLSKEFDGEFETFSSMSINRIMEVTGLSQENATLASTREFGEPVNWLGSEERREEFINRLNAMGAKPVLGGRFLHICGNCSKGRALKWLTSEYQRQFPETKVTSVALGDGPNDIAMLEVADYAVIVASPVNPPPILQRTNRTINTQHHGPEGWTEALEYLIPRLVEKEES